MMETIANEFIAAWDVGPAVSMRAPEAGTINQTLLIDTASGTYVLRAYRHSDRAPVEREHAVIAYARARGLPAVTPMSLPGGATLLERDGRFYALFPHAPGRQIGRTQIGMDEVAAMGRCLAEMHRGLRDYPAARAVRRSFDIDRGAVLAHADELEQAIRAIPRPDATDRGALAALDGRREWIERAGAVRPADLSGLDHQLIHGDYQDANLFFENGHVSAIIDWDETYLAPPAWEIARTMHLMWNFALGPCRTFLAAYRAVLPLAGAELDLAATYYGWFRAHDLWVYDAAYLEGNRRVRAFLPSAGFVSLVERWAALRAQLDASSM